MHKAIFGINRQENLNWFRETWLKDGPAVCFMEGFPGVGKSALSEDLLTHVQKLNGWHSFFDEVTDRATPSVSDTFFDLAEMLSEQGLKGMEHVLLSDDEPNLAVALEKALRNQVLIVLDEAQRLFRPDTGLPLLELEGVLSHLRGRANLRGRLLLLSDRHIEQGRWCEGFPVRTLSELSDGEAVQLLEDRLQASSVTDAIPEDRKPELVRAMGCNPRAIETLVSSLTYDPLDEIVGRNPGFWSVHDRDVSREFLEKLEKDLLERTMAHLAPLHNKRLLQLSVYRKSFENPAFEFICAGTRKEWRDFRNVLITRFLLRQVLGWHSLHPIVREIGLAHLKDNLADFKQAHSKAADYYLRHFKAREIVAGHAKLTASLAELRYHLHHSGRHDELREVIRAMTDRLKKNIKSVSPVPTDEYELDERIAVLSNLLEDGGAKGLEYHLAQCLKKRGKPGDFEQAIIHAERATGAGAPDYAWVLLAQLQAQTNLNQAVKTMYEAVNLISETDKAFALYCYGAELLERAGETKDAEIFLRNGLLKVQPQFGLDSLYRSCAELLSREGRPKEAIELLREGIGKIPPRFSLFALYQSCAELLSLEKRPDEAIELLREGIGKIPRKFGRHKLFENLIYLAAAARRKDWLNDVVTGSLSSLDSAQQVPLATSLLHQIDAQWVRAAQVAQEGRLQAVQNLQLCIQEAFSWLAAGETSKAQKALDAFPTCYKSGRPNTWLACFVALRRGDMQAAQWLFAAYRGVAEAQCKCPTEADLLAIWNSPIPLSTPHPAYYLSTLPPTLTGLDHSITRPPTHEVCIEISVRIRVLMGDGVSQENKSESRSQATPTQASGQNPSLSILAMATEWRSGQGGLTTFNRELCSALAKAGHRVVCAVPNAQQNEIESVITETGVTLISAPSNVDTGEMSGLYRRLALPDGFVPDVVIGHGRITGPAARVQVEDNFSSAIRVHFMHMSPREIEWFKGKDNAAQTAEAREQLELDLAKDAGLVVAVGPRLFTEAGNLLAGLKQKPQLHRFDPGLNSATKGEPPPAYHCLVLGRAEVMELKGLDIAVQSMAKVINGDTIFESKPELVVRGAPKDTGVALKASLMQYAKRTDLSITVREYTSNEETIEQDLRRASVLLMPSRREGFGLVAMEALDQGTPILVSNKSGMGELLTELLGAPEAQNFVVPTADDATVAADAWSKAIEFVLRDRNAAFGRTAVLSKKLAASNSWSSAISKLERAIDNARHQKPVQLACN